MQIEELEKKITEIERRNARVEADKAWETSSARIVLITIITYVIAVIVFFLIENANPFRNALIPAVAFYLSVQTIPFAKQAWIKRYRSKEK